MTAELVLSISTNRRELEGARGVAHFCGSCFCPERIGLVASVELRENVSGIEKDTHRKSSSSTERFCGSR